MKKSPRSISNWSKFRGGQYNQAVSLAVGFKYPFTGGGVVEGGLTGEKNLPSPLEGVIQWSIPLDHGTWSSPIVSSREVIYVGSASGIVYALTYGGENKDSSEVNNVRNSNTQSNNQKSSNHRRLNVVENKGKVLWKYATGGVVTSTPTLAPDEGVLYVGSADSYLYAIETVQGTLLWRYKTEGKITSSPALNVVENAGGGSGFPIVLEVWTYVRRGWRWGGVGMMDSILEEGKVVGRYFSLF